MYGAFNRDTEEHMRNWLKGFTAERLKLQIEITERLLDDDTFNDSLLLDHGFDLLTMLRDECVRRVTGYGD